MKENKKESRKSNRGSKDVISFRWVKRSTRFTKSGRIKGLSSSTKTYIKSIMNVATSSKALKMNQKPNFVLASLFLFFSIIFTGLGILALCLIGVRIESLYPALGINVTWVVIVLDIMFSIICTALCIFSLIYGIFKFDESTRALLLYKMDPEKLKEHFENYFSTNMKDFEEVLGKKNIRIKFKFKIEENRRENMKFTADEGNKKEVKIDKWVVGKVRFYGPKYKKKNSETFNPFE